MIVADGDDLKKCLAAKVVGLARGKERFVVALSGGSMPKLLAGLLDEDVDWTAWDVFFADERCVPPDDADANVKACREHLFDKIRGEGPRIHALDATLAPAAAAEAYAAELKTCGGRFDLALLGMGPDGHTASLFPGHDAYGRPASKSRRGVAAAAR